MKLLHTIASTPLNHNGVIVSAAIVAGLLFVLLYSRYRSLKHVPGPLLASLTDLWLFSKVWRGVGYRAICRDLHAQYGPVIRLGPKRVFFAQPEATSTIYSSTNAFKKVQAIKCRVILFPLTRCVGRILRSDPDPCEWRRGSVPHFH